VGSLKEIRRRIGSVKNTKQITRAMKLVSAAKLRKAQEAAVSGRGFGKRLQHTLAVVREGLKGDFVHPLLEKKEEVKIRRAIVIAGERGLCGAYNTSVFKAVEQGERDLTNCDMEYVPVGRRAVAYSKQADWDVVSSYEGLPEDAGLWPIAEIVEKQVRSYLAGECDEIVIYYTEFVSAMTQNVKREIILPFTVDTSSNAATSSSAETENVEVVKGAKTDPSPEELIGKMIPLLINTRLTQAALESKASEHASRMTAMDSATRNADDLMDSLKLFYNRARQSAITTELIDIVGGAEAANG